MKINCYKLLSSIFATIVLCSCSTTNQQVIGTSPTCKPCLCKVEVTKTPEANKPVPLPCPKQPQKIKHTAKNNDSIDIVETYITRQKIKSYIVVQ